MGAPPRRDVSLIARVDCHNGASAGHVLGESHPTIRELPDGGLEISVEPQFRNGEALAAELREFGVEIDIEMTPASPSLVGQAGVFNQAGGDYVPEGLDIPPTGRT